MVANNYNFMKKIFFSIILLLCTYGLYAQTTGLIIEPANGASITILDPDGNGYVSLTTAGFLGDDKANSEVPFNTLIPAGIEPDSDIRNGPDCGFSDFVESVSGGIDPAFHYSDGTYWYFRMRMAGIAPNAKSYSVLIDTDDLIGPTAPNYTVDNPGFEIEIVLETKLDRKSVV